MRERMSEHWADCCGLAGKRAKWQNKDFSHVFRRFSHQFSLAIRFISSTHHAHFRLSASIACPGCSWTITRNMNMENWSQLRVFIWNVSPHEHSIFLFVCIKICYCDGSLAVQIVWIIERRDIINSIHLNRSVISHIVAVSTTQFMHCNTCNEQRSELLSVNDSTELKEDVRFSFIHWIDLLSFSYQWLLLSLLFYMIIDINKFKSAVYS